MLVRKRAIEEVGLLDERFFMYFEDLDWGFRFGKTGWKVSYDPAIQVTHYKRASTRQVAPDMIRQFFKSHILGYNKHFAGNSPLIINILIRFLLKFKMYVILFYDYLEFGPWKEKIPHTNNKNVIAQQTASTQGIFKYVRSNNSSSKPVSLE